MRSVRCSSPLPTVHCSASVKRIAIVRAGDRWLVLGITAQAIATLAELDEAPPAAASAPVGLVLPGAFAQVLGGLRRGSSASAPAPGEPR